MTVPASLTVTHLRAALVPLVPDATETTEATHRQALVATFDRSIERIDLRDVVNDAWRRRLPRLPVPPRRPQTLQETVQAARARLRQDRVDRDAVELGNRRFVLDHLRGVLR